MVPWITSRRSASGNLPRVHENVSEIDGGELVNRTAVYLHLEQGLAKSPNSPAIISLQQSAGHLADLELNSERFHRSNNSYDSEPDVSNPEKPSARRRAWNSTAKTLFKGTKTSVIRPISNRVNGLGIDGRKDKGPLKLSYMQLHHISQTIAAGLIANGVQPLSNVLMLTPNGAEYGLLLWSSVLIGLHLPVPILRFLRDQMLTNSERSYAP